MKSTLLVALALAVTAPLTATAQFIPTLGSDTPRICPEQPPRPDWIENINFRDADKAILVQEMYRAQSMQAVADTGDCSCETRHPPPGTPPKPIISRTTHAWRNAGRLWKELLNTGEQQTNTGGSPFRSVRSKATGEDC